MNPNTICFGVVVAILWAVFLVHRLDDNRTAPVISDILYFASVLITVFFIVTCVPLYYIFRATTLFTVILGCYTAYRLWVKLDECLPTLLQQCNDAWQLASSMYHYANHTWTFYDLRILWRRLIV